MAAGADFLPSWMQKHLQEASLPISEKFSLTRLPAFFPLMVVAFVFFQIVEWIAPIFIRFLSPINFGQADKRTKRNWAIRVVSMTHAFIIIPLAFGCLDSPELDEDRAFGFNNAVGRMAAVTCGYFIWDLIDSIGHFAGIGFVIHAAMCLIVYSQSFRPFLGYYGPRFLLWELSTPFLNIHWFLDKSNMTGTTVQKINGFFLITTFFLVRLCYGGLMSYRFFITLLEVRSQLPHTLANAFAIGNVSLQTLNWFWFFKMLQSLQKRLSVNEKGVPATPSNGYLSNDSRKLK